MEIVDAHTHASPAWYEPVEALLHQMDTYGVERAVLVQINGQYDNAYQMDCVRRHRRRFASVVAVNPAGGAAEKDLEELAARGAAGLRMRATALSQGRDPLALWRAAERLHLPVSCSGDAFEFASPEFQKLVKELPELPIILEHLAGKHHPDDKEPFELRQKAFELARMPNVYVKIHGLGEFARRLEAIAEPFPFERPLPPILDMAYQAFGPTRMMWGSDYPPVSNREGYGNALRLTMNELEGLDADDRSSIFRRTAEELYFNASQIKTG